jgi:hypothetical protein
LPTGLFRWLEKKLQILIRKPFSTNSAAQSYLPQVYELDEDVQESLLQQFFCLFLAADRQNS